MASESLVGPLTSDDPPRRLDAERLVEAVGELATADRRLGGLVERNGAPPLWDRPEGFPTLVKIILEQQVSLASAAAAYARLAQHIRYVRPDRFLRLNDAELLAIGFSRRKAGYCRGLATGLLDGSVVLADLSTVGDVDARRRLMEVRGVGPWTADVYLMFALGRADVWPPGDRALLVAIGSLLGREPMASDDAARHAARWAPWRSVAARLLWHDYLGGSPGPA